MASQSPGPEAIENIVKLKFPPVAVKIIKKLF
jgi:hypothetical protein